MPSRLRRLGVPISSVVAFWTVSFLLVMVPGADWAYAITAGLRHRTVVPAIGGLLIGYVVLTATVAAGVAALVARSPHWLTMLTAAGAAYLVWLGISMLVKPSDQPQAGTEEATRDSWVRNAIKGLGTSALNPKALLLFVALLPQFTHPAGRWPLAVQIVILGLVHMGTCAVVYTSVGAGARVVLRTRPSAARIVARISGVAMVGIGVSLVAERLIG
jgi:threonine/homoserine/homoserine lactone efflux protein